MGALPDNRFDAIDRTATADKGWDSHGLSETEAAARFKREGPNELASAKPPSVFRTALQVLREPMFLLLIGTGVVYVLLGDPKEAVALMVAVFVIIGITFYQERKTEHALQALRELSSPRALVIRDGERRRIAGREVVRGDLVVLAEGDRIPADGLVLESRNLTADESLLTGESVPVRKVAAHGDVAMEHPGGDDQPFVFSGTLVAQGKGIARITATGPLTELGKIGKALEGLRQEDTHLQRETNRLVRFLAVFGLFLCAFVAVAYGYTRGDWLRGVLAGLTLAISMIPEEFPVVLTIFLALGAWRISRQRVLTRRMPAIETLGSATVLCVDKTGTLTLNRMTVEKLFAGGEYLNLPSQRENQLPEKFHQTVEFSILASSRDPFDPMEKAFLQLGDQYSFSTNHLHPERVLAREYPLSSDLPAMSRAWETPGSKGYLVAAKGAPEAIISLCRLGVLEERKVLAATGEMAASGLRVLGVARAHWAGALPGSLPDDQRVFKFSFVGLVGLADPLRPSVPAAVKDCYAAGIRVIMITGDYPVTAKNIAAQIPLRNATEVITGPELRKMSDSELERRIRTVNIFARVVPEQKLQLIHALRATGEVVAMTGDGVNDAPALKAADIGVAMGARGTDVAREAAAMVLLDDDFSSIVNAIRLGRRIYDNLKKATAYILALHVPIAGLSLVPVLVGWPLILMPLHVLFLELVTDPACSIAFEAEPEEANVMKRPPRDPRERLFPRDRVTLSLLQGLTVLLCVLAVYAVARQWGHDETDCRTLAFATLVVGNVALIFTNRSWTNTIWETQRTPNPALWWIVGGALAMLALMFYVPFLRDFFRFSVMHPADLLVAGLAGFLGVLWFELLKLIRRKFARPVAVGS
jgi:P-type Ca2+ transporter type 2C